MGFIAVVVVALTVDMAMVMASAGAAQECHRAIEELFLGYRAVLVGIERTEQSLGAALSE